MKDTLLSWWFIISSFAIAFLYFLLVKKGEKLDEVIYEKQTQMLDAKLKKAKEKLDVESETYEDDYENYNKLKKRYQPLIDKLGIDSK